MSKLSEPRVQAILRALENGCTRRAAAAAGDITHQTFYNWVNADLTLMDAVVKAEQKAEQRFTEAVVAAIPKSWQAAAWWLERRKHEDYAQRNKVEVDLRSHVRRVAEETGLDEDTVMAEAQAILGGRR